MPASFPSSVKAFTTKSDGAGNTILAAHINDLQAEVTAIENCLLGNTSLSAVLGGTLTVTGATTLTGALIGNDTTDSTSTTTGAFQTDGGLGVAKALWVGGLANIAGVLTLSAAGTHAIAGSVAFGSVPSTTGTIRLSNGEFLKGRNAANSADLSMIGVNGSNKISIDADGTGTVMGGALNVAGALSKGSGTFLIDHPLAALAQTHDLYHGFIEGPRHDLIYRGVAPGAGVFSIDAASRMTSGTFEALTQQPQVWAQHESGAPVRVRVVNGDVVIACDTPGEIAWFVMAERADRCIRTSPSVDGDGRLIPEARKSNDQPLRHA